EFRTGSAKGVPEGYVCTLTLPRFSLLHFPAAHTEDVITPSFDKAVHTIEGKHIAGRSVAPNDGASFARPPNALIGVPSPQQPFTPVSIVMECAEHLRCLALGAGHPCEEDVLANSVDASKSSELEHRHNLRTLNLRFSYVTGDRN